MKKRILMLFVMGTVITVAAILLQVVLLSREKKPGIERTVLIYMMSPDFGSNTEPVEEALPIPNDEYRTMRKASSFVVAEGLGTMVAHGEELIIVTHDHWSLLDSELGNVEKRDAVGHLMMELSIRDFRKQIRHRDGGAMHVVVSPDWFVSESAGLSVIQVPAGGNRLPRAGEGVYVVHRQQNSERTVEVMSATVEDITLKQGQPVFRLRNKDGSPIAPGDSGGGIWFDGQLVGVLWTTIMLQDTLTGEQEYTESSIAAIVTIQLSAVIASA